MNLFKNEIINISTLELVNNGIVTEEWVSNINVTNGFRKNFYALVYYVTSGSSILYKNQVIKNAPGSIRYIPIGNFDDSKIFDYSAGNFVSIYFDTPDFMPTDILSFNNIEHLENKFIKLANIWKNKKNGYYVDAMILFYEIIRGIKTFESKYQTKFQSKKLDAAYDYILKNFKEPNFDYKELCKKTGLGYSYFSELFVSEYNMSPVKMVTNLRIDYAKDLLATNNYKITNIANMCGYENPYYFSKVFKKVTGLSPKDYSKILY